MTPAGKIAIVGLLCAAPALTRATLVWPVVEIHCTTQPLQTSIDVAFTFRNGGSAPVAIRDIQTNCDCLVASADKKTYQPGQSGMVVARFAVGDRTGAYERSIFVLADGNAPAQRLQVRIEVPETARVSPTTREWPIATTPDEQTVDLTVAPGLLVHFTEAFSSSDDFRARIEVLETGRRYRVYIRPLGTGEATSTAIRLLGKAESGEDVVVSAYAHVR